MVVKGGAAKTDPTYHIASATTPQRNRIVCLQNHSMGGSRAKRPRQRGPTAAKSRKIQLLVRTCAAPPEL